MKKSSLVGLSALMLLLVGCGDALGDTYVSFAQCLTQKNATFYGAYWCPHCAEQKELFGYKAVKELNYVECDPRGSKAKPELCKQKEVKSYPTWIFADSTRLTGTQPLQTLSEKTGCPLPVKPEKEEATSETTTK